MSGQAGEEHWRACGPLLTCFSVVVLHSGYLGCVYSGAYWDGDCLCKGWEGDWQGGLEQFCMLGVLFCFLFFGVQSIQAWHRQC